MDLVDLLLLTVICALPVLTYAWAELQGERRLARRDAQLAEAWARIERLEAELAACRRRQLPF